jgi:hypothetical protein
MSPKNNTNEFLKEDKFEYKTTSERRPFHNCTHLAKKNLLFISEDE